MIVNATITTSETKKVTLDKSSIKEVIKNCDIKDLLSAIEQRYLESKGLPEEAEFKDGLWQEYENNGSHYSGYYSIRTNCGEEEYEELQYLLQVISGAFGDRNE